MIKEYIIEERYDKITVRNYVRSVLGISARTFKNLKYKGSVKADGREVFADYSLSHGTVLRLEFPEERSETVESENIPLDIIYEDSDFLAVNKPFNMPVHPSQNHHTGTLANAVMYRYRSSPFVFRALTRLDIDTTGVVIIAKNAVSAASFAKADVKKEYLAVCRGVPNPHIGTVNAPIGRAEGIIKRCVSESGKPSLIEYEVLETFGNFSLVRAIPVTGRTHQIRVHMAHIGCPLYGDYLYGEEIPGERTRLHCERVSFVHPSTHKSVLLSAPAPSDFRCEAFDFEKIRECFCKKT